MKTASGFAVVDVETTGIVASMNRIIEIAVVQLNSDGERTGEFTTLLNPKRDLGPTHVHGIRASDVADAPEFADIAERLTEAIAGRVLVAHNASFDLGFLVAEYSRLGVQLPDLPTLCTLRLADRFIPGAGRSLKDCCTAAGVTLERAHEALDDARATAGLFRAYLAAGLESQDHVEAAESVRWPACPSGGAELVTRTSAAARRAAEPSYLADLIGRLPVDGADGELAPYLELLDRVFLDRKVAAQEAAGLEGVAREIGLRAGAVLHAHELYLERLAQAAWADEVITDAEHADLELVARLLGLSGDAVDAALARGRAVPAVVADRGPAPALAGQTVVFTGDADGYTRAELTARAEAQGMIVKSGVTKKTSMLVAADSDTQSGKAQKAHGYGVPVIALTAFLSMTA